MGGKHVENEGSEELCLGTGCRRGVIQSSCFSLDTLGSEAGAEVGIKTGRLKYKTYTIFLPSPYVGQQQPMVVICSPSKYVEEMFSEKIEIN